MVSCARTLPLAAGILAPAVLALGLACGRPPSAAPEETGPVRVAVTSEAYGAHPELPDALALGEAVELEPLPLADGGELELANVLGVGPAILVWVGGAEHAELSAWVEALDAALAAFDSRASTLIFVRPLGPETALDWAIELGLQATVVADPWELLAPRLGMDSYDDAAIDFAVLVIDPEGRLRYRKLGVRRPGLEELGAVVDGFGEGLRCCPGACVGEPCIRD